MIDPYQPNANDDLDKVLLMAGHLPDLATPDDYLIADNMLHRANGNHYLASEYFRSYIASHRRSP